MPVNENVLVVFPSPAGVNENVKHIYLDNQATAAMSPGVLDAMIPYFSQGYGNPHSSEHAFGWRAGDAVDTARSQIADALGFDAEEVVFTSGATEANNLALLGFDRDERTSFAISAIEHKSVIAPVRERVRNGSTAHVVGVDRDGRTDLDELRTALASGVAMVSVMAANNEIGTVQPLSEIAEMCRASGALLHVDAAQALPFGGFDAQVVAADLVSVSSHKAGGPAGVGALLIARRVRQRLSPILFGGGQEDGLRAGTLPMPLCVGFGAACAVLPDAAEVATWRQRSETLAALLAAAVPGLTRNGAVEASHPGNVSVTVPNGEAGALIARLQPNVAVSTGSACTSGIPEPSHVLRAIGLDAGAADRTIRLSVGRQTTEEEIAEAARLFAEAWQRQRAAA